MAKEPKLVWKAKDDSDHPSKDAAERHNALLAAKEEFEAAARTVTRLLGATALTADGQPFDMEASRDYYYVRDSFIGLPTVAEIWVWPHNAFVDTDRGESELCVRWWNTSGKEWRYETYRIAVLYASREAAQKACVEKAAERLREMQDAFAKLQIEYVERHRGGRR